MRRLFLLAILTALALAGGRTGVDAQADASGVSIEVTGLPPGSPLEIALNGGKVADATAGSQGSAASILDFANLGKPQVRIEVWLEVCEDGRRVLHLVSDDEDGLLPEDDGTCSRRPIGAFWTNRATRVVIDAGTGAIQVSNTGLSGTQIGLIGGGAGAVAIGLLTRGGSDTVTTPAPTHPPATPPPAAPPPPPPPPAFTPAGTYASSTNVTSDSGGHYGFIQLAQSLQLSVMTNTPISISGPGGSNWVTVSGDWNSSTGAFSLTGSGTVAGFPNVGVRFVGTITTTGALSGDYTMGTGGELPGGQATTYRVQGQKQ